MHSRLTNTSRVEYLGYPDAVTDLVEHFAHQPWSIWLDSGHPASTAGRYDIIVADPVWRITGSSHGTRVVDSDGLVHRVEGDPLLQIRQLLGEQQALPEGVPFAGGAVGYLSYDLGRHYEGLPANDESRSWPMLAVGLYDWAIVVDHQLHRAMLVSNSKNPIAEDRWQAVLDILQSAPTESVSIPSHFGTRTTRLSRQRYDTSFNAIQHYITEGDCYQVNYAQRFESEFSGDPWMLYQRFRAISPAPYSAYLNLPAGQILSTSPEQFLALNNRQVITRPIKGTRPRAQAVQDDEQLRETLRLSPKDRAENLMIVDLLRNDLGKVCKPGSIRVPALFQLQSFAQVHHLVSVVEGELRDGEDALSLLSACLPGGSITGAPKHRAMQIIDELESAPRGIYCGSIFRIGFDGGLDSNIAIRTLDIRDGKAGYWAGGGIVADSQLEAEYQESLDKAAAYFELLDSPSLRGAK